MNDWSLLARVRTCSASAEPGLPSFTRSLSVLASFSTSRRPPGRWRSARRFVNRRIRLQVRIERLLQLRRGLRELLSAASTTSPSPMRRTVACSDNGNTHPGTPASKPQIVFSQACSIRFRPWCRGSAAGRRHQQSSPAGAACRPLGRSPRNLDFSLFFDLVDVLLEVVEKSARRSTSPFGPRMTLFLRSLSMALSELVPASLDPGR